MNKIEKTITMMAYTISTLIGLIAVVVSWLNCNTSGFSSTLSEAWKILNIIPFMIAALPSNGYDFNYSIYYISIFAQWTLITLLIFCVKKVGQVTGRKSA